MKFVELNDGNRRIEPVQTVADLPAVVDIPLPVTCWVWDSGMYQYGTGSEWHALYTIPSSPNPGRQR